jgi:hypothetical protein
MDLGHRMLLSLMDREDDDEHFRTKIHLQSLFALHNGSHDSCSFFHI